MRFLMPEQLEMALVDDDRPYAAIDVVLSTGSTNADLRRAADAGAADYTVLLAERQTRGVGRQGRQWESPPGGIYLSVLLRPDVPPAAVGSLAAVAGLALVETAEVCEVQTSLKWPNDVLSGGKKLAGVLSELVPGITGEPSAVVLGIGLNVHPIGDVPPGPGALAATSIEEQGGSTTSPTSIAIVLLDALVRREKPWRAAGGDLAKAGLLDEYRKKCSTLGTNVQVALPGEQSLEGRAVDVDPAGQLVVQTADGRRTTVFAGDVIHVR